jgi:hypothetical protein
MGCDIHVVAQVLIAGKWKTNSAIICDDRSYDTFAVLANVRNGYGFAGIPTGEAYEPISKPRGFPPGFEVDGEDHNGKWMGDHSHSYVSLAELMDYADRHATTRRTKFGVIPVAVYEHLKETGGAPNDWSYGISGPGIITLPSDAYNYSKRHGLLLPEKQYYVQYSWGVSALETTYIPELIAQLLELQAEYDVANHEVRLVFGFDS